MRPAKHKQKLGKKSFIAFILMLAIGVFMYDFFGTWSLDLWITEPDTLLTWVVIRAHLFGLFFASMGIFGIIRWCCDNDLIRHHKPN
jgi:hypothetical protein